jgi:hypothetical protein
MREDETHQWNELAISFSAQADKEHRGRTEELKRQCMEAIHDAELRLDVRVKNAQSMFSIFALFGRATSGGEQVVQGVRLDARLELRMKPEQDVAPQTPLEFPSRLANRDGALLLRRPPLPFFFQEDIGKPRQRPETQEAVALMT